MASAFSPEEVAREKAHWNDDKSPTVVAGSIILIVTATLAVTLRLISRKFRRLALGADDYMIVLALMFAYGMFISILFCKLQNLSAIKRALETLPSAAIHPDNQIDRRTLWLRQAYRPRRPCRCHSRRQSPLRPRGHLPFLHRQHQAQHPTTLPPHLHHQQPLLQIRPLRRRQHPRGLGYRRLFHHRLPMLACAYHLGSLWGRVH